MCAIDITAEQRKTVLALLARHLPNTTAWVYGSRVKWTARPESDLDLVVFATPEQAGRVSDLREAFEESNLPFRVDLFVWDTVPQQFRKAIEAEHVVLVKKEEPGVVGGWREATLDQLGRIVTGRTPPSKIQGFFGGEIPFVTPTDLDGRRVIVSTGRSLTKKGVEAVYNSRIPARSVMVSCIGSDMGKTAIAARECVTNQQINSIVVDSGNEPLFVYYNLSNRKVEIHAAAGGSAQPILNKSGFGQFDILLPPPDQQRAIAHILGTLDDKIELNRRMNQTLEEMARALFKSWFIDFDPVRAKATLKQHDTNHSPLEGESARQGRSPQSSRWGEIKRSYTQQTLERARTLRQDRTDAEGLLWHYLCNKQLDGYNFRRQQPIGPYVVDFACMSRKLVIELDGGQHAEQHNYDKKREDYLRGKGYRILRFWNDEVFQNCMDVLEAVYQALVGPPPHQPSPDGSASATPPQGGSDWSVERARAYLDRVDPNIAALFPNHFVDSELGPIPEGWEVKHESKSLAERGMLCGPFGSSIKVSTFVYPGDSCYRAVSVSIPCSLGTTNIGPIRHLHPKKLACRPMFIAGT